MTLGAEIVLWNLVTALTYIAEVEYREAEQTLGVKDGTPINTMASNHCIKRKNEPMPDVCETLVLTQSAIV